MHAVHKSDQRDAELDLEPPSEKKSKMANDRQTLSASQSKMANDRQMSSVFQSKMASASQSAIINHIFDLLGQAPDLQKKIKESQKFYKSKYMILMLEKKIGPPEPRKQYTKMQLKFVL